jgi:hypothetical protein
MGVSTLCQNENGAIEHGIATPAADVAVCTV